MSGIKKLGDMLKEAGLIDDFQLQTALSHQRNWGGKLGSILMELKFIKEADIVRAISEKLHIPHIDLFEPEISESIIRMIKAEIAKKYHVVPVRKEGSALMLAMFDPFDIEAADEIRFITGLTIKPCLAMESEITDAIRKYYDGEDINRSESTSLAYQWEDPHGKMEIIRDRDLLKSSSGTDAGSPLLSREALTLQTLTDTKMRLDALITLLIEKKLITREDLVSMVYQKKMGL